MKLNSGVDYRGVLACLDGYMNIAMEQTEEVRKQSVGSTVRLHSARVHTDSLYPSTVCERSAQGEIW